MFKKLMIVVMTFYSFNTYSFDVSTFITLSKQETLLNKSEIIANNVANAETPGFKENRLIEKEYRAVIPQSKDNIYTNDISSVMNMENGNLTKTGNNLDLAILGDGFFLIKTVNGTRYTRAGNFILNEARNLVTVDGNKVLDTKKSEITFPQGINDIIIKENGTIFADGIAISQIGIGFFKNNHMLIQEGKSLLKHLNDKNEEKAEEETFQIAQGFLESSNVNRVKQLTTLIEVQRDTALVSGLLNTFDEMGRNAINKLGKY